MLKCFGRSPLYVMLILGMMFSIIPDRGSHAEERNYILTTATTGGTYYPVGVALSTLVKLRLLPSHKISMSTISSAGSGENIKLMRSGEAQFAILQGLYGKWAVEGSGRVAADGPQTHLRSVSMLWQNVEHFLLRSDYAVTGTVNDLKGMIGQPFSIGKRNSGTEGSGLHILENMGIEADNFAMVNLGYGPTADALQNGRVIGANMPAGPPAGAVTRSFASLGSNLTLLSFTQDDLRRVNRGGDLWSMYTIPAGTYPGQMNDVKTIAQPNFLAVNADVPEEDVYLITKSMYENLPLLGNIHQATKAMSVAKAIEGLPMPLHPGAVRFYREMGLEIPDHMISPRDTASLQ